MTQPRPDAVLEVRQDRVRRLVVDALRHRRRHQLHDVAVATATAARWRHCHVAERPASENLPVYDDMWSG